MIKNENYITIQGWMLNDLELKGNELIVYSVIHGFSQEESHSFHGSAQYLADWCGSSRQSIMGCLKSLVEKGFLTKTDVVINKVKLCEYKAVNPVKKVDIPCKESLHPLSNKFTPPCKESLHNIISIQDSNTIKDKDMKKGSEYEEIELHYSKVFKEVIQNGEPIIDYGAVRRRLKNLFTKLPKDKIIQAIENARHDKWLVDNGFSMLMILGDNQLNKLLNGKSAIQSPFKTLSSSEPIRMTRCSACGGKVDGFGTCDKCGIEYDTMGRVIG